LPKIQNFCPEWHQALPTIAWGPVLNQPSQFNVTGFVSAAFANLLMKGGREKYLKNILHFIKNMKPVVNLYIVVMNRFLYRYLHVQVYYRYWPRGVAMEVFV
jgi:hypothetical protein